MFTTWGRLGGFFQRHVIDNDAFFAIVASTQNFSIHDVAFTFGASAEVFAGEFAISANLEYTRELNRYYDLRNDVTNIGSRFAIRWDLPR